MDPENQSEGSQETIFDEAPIGEARKILQPTSENDVKLQELKTFLIDWMNNELKQEHIVVKSLEEDLFDGLILHHLLQKIADIKIEVEEITLSAINQKRKLGVILEAVTSCLQLEERQLKWDMSSIHNKDLLATLHLLVALARHYRPDLPLPPNVSVEVVVMEPTKTGMKTGKAIEFVTKSRDEGATHKKDGFDQLFEVNPEKVNDVKQAMLNFVNKQLINLSLTVTDIDTQFADGVILLLLIGQLEGYFINLSAFFLTPTSEEDKLHNISLALDLLVDEGTLQTTVDPAEIVNGDIKSTLRVLYSLFLKHKKASKPS
ncbi:gamma-parvin isoform 2-T2 [Anomaloglossus baeobatrachus]|uniref:gamma-parvin isoform X1 n=1 Tax=Anomaloglossus baeobatrachus TaxID=238106 RepID=UPI003F5069E7